MTILGILLPLAPALLLPVQARGPVTQAPAPLDVCAGPAVDSLGLATTGTPGRCTLRMEGAPVPGLPFELVVENALPGSTGTLFLGTEDLEVFLPGLGGSFFPAGMLGTQTFRVYDDGRSDRLQQRAVVPPALCGRTLVAQALVVDPQASGGFALTKALRVRFGGQPRAVVYPGLIAYTGTPKHLDRGDLDGDGRQDLLVVKFGGANVLLARADGGFEELQELGGFFDASWGAIADLDADGAADVVLCGTEHSFVGARVYLGNGDGTFAASVDYPLPGVSAREVRVVDLNADAIPDLALAFVQAGVPSLAVLFGLGDGTFVGGPTTPIDPAAFEVSALAFADFDADGTLDLAASVWSLSAPDAQHLRLGNGDGTFGPASTYPLGDVPTCAAAGDWNGDGAVDLLVSHFVSGDLYLFPGLGDGSLAAPSIQAGPGGSSSEFALGDFDGDGATEAAVVGGASIGLLDLRRDGTLGALSSFPSSFGFYPQAPILAWDQDRDGIDDLAIGIDAASLNRPFVTFRFGAAGGLWDALPRSLPTGFTGTHEIAAGDLNGDQLVDLAVTHGSSVTVFAAAPDGSFASVATHALASASLGLALGDLDRDGRTDLLVRTAPGIDVLLGQPGGTLAPATGVAALAGEDLGVGDLDGDGLADAVTVSPNGDRIEVHLGRGDGTFDPPLATVVSNPLGLELADLDNDGFLDVAIDTVRPTALFGVQAFLGTGDGGLVPQASRTTSSLGMGGTVRDLAVGDWDVDGIADLALLRSSHFAPNLSWIFSYRGDGAGEFAAPLISTADSDAHTALLAVDVDRDGLPDLVAAGDSSPGTTLDRRLAVLLGRGDGTFGVFRYAVVHSPTELAIADLDGDQLPDLITVSAVDHTIDILDHGLFR